MRITLNEDGSQWAELRDPNGLTNGQRKPYMRLLAGLPSKPDGKGGEIPDLASVDGGTILEIGEALLIAFVAEWSFGPTPEEDPEALDNIPATVYDQLQVAAGRMIEQLPIPKAEADEPNL